MSDKKRYQLLFNYHWHTTRQLMDYAAKLDAADFKDGGGYGHGSIHSLLLHLLSTDHGWRAGFEGRQQPPSLPADEYATLEALRAAFDTEQTAWDVVLANLTDEQVGADADFTSPQGQTIPIPRWQVLEHLLLHGMQHHAEMAHLLTDQGHSPGNLDFIFYEE
jgi:uncharacterized damage-inducible protein DinB